MRRRRAFTLVELLIVVTIIGIIIAFVLRAAVGGIRQAERSATVALIAKLEAGMTDRVDALSSQHPEPTAAHYVLAQVFNGAFPNGVLNSPATQRAQVIANYDYMRAELPDVFVIQAAIPTSGLPNGGIYPLNFGGAPWGNAGDYTDYLLPLGANIRYLPTNSAYNYASTLLGTGPHPYANAIGITPQNTGMQPDPADPYRSLIQTPAGLQATGIYGASFASAAAVYKQLGYGPQGMDGADNDGDGFIDDLREGVMGMTPADRDATLADIATKLANHKHSTARAEMLYAVLIEGTGPLGSVFQRDDFNDQEVKDTDGDGLMEFVDAWGQPLQFFRWPILYRSDAQRGFPDLAKITQDRNLSLLPGPYASVYENRDVNTLDPNQQLLAPAWWSIYNSGPAIDAPQGSVSGAAMTFQRHFHTLAEPWSSMQTGPSVTYWDRSQVATVNLNGVAVSYYPRRAYYSRFLILSGGSDKVPGVAGLTRDYRALDERSQFPLFDGSYASGRDSTGAPLVVEPPGQIRVWTQNEIDLVIQVENQGGKIDPNRSGPGTLRTPSMPGYRNDTNTFLEEASNDDITSQNLNSLGGPPQ